MEPPPKSTQYNIITWGNYRIIRGFHFLDFLGSLGKGWYLIWRLQEIRRYPRHSRTPTLNAVWGLGFRVLSQTFLRAWEIFTRLRVQ